MTTSNPNKDLTNRIEALLLIAEMAEGGVMLRCKYCGTDNRIESEEDLSHCWNCAADLQDSVPGHNHKEA